jgi:CBS domain-containing protein
MLARDLMSTGLLTFLPDMGLEPAARAMAERGVSGAPVVQGDGVLGDRPASSAWRPTSPRRHPACSARVRRARTLHREGACRCPRP